MRKLVPPFIITANSTHNGSNDQYCRDVELKKEDSGLKVTMVFSIEYCCVFAIERPDLVILHAALISSAPYTCNEKDDLCYGNCSHSFHSRGR